MIMESLLHKARRTFLIWSWRTDVTKFPAWASHLTWICPLCLSPRPVPSICSGGTVPISASPSTYNTSHTIMVLKVSVWIAARVWLIWLFFDAGPDEEQPDLPLTRVWSDDKNQGNNKEWENSVCVLSKCGTEWTLLLRQHFGWRQGGNPDDAHTYAHTS